LSFVKLAELVAVVHSLQRCFFGSQSQAMKAVLQVLEALLVFVLGFLLHHKCEAHMPPLIQHLLLVAIIDGCLTHPGCAGAL
jgi:hypothetical protein